MGRRGPLLLVIVSALILAFLLVPIVILVPLSLTSGRYLTFPPPGYSLQWFRKIFGDERWVRSMWVSARVAMATAVAGTALGTLTSMALSRGEFPGKRAVYALVLLPLIVPGIITAVALYFFFARVRLVGTLTAIVIGHTAIALPVAVIILGATMQGIDRRLEQAALIVGADPLTVFRRITLPLIAPGVVSAALFCFLTSFDELLIPLFVAGPGNQTLPVQIWNTVLFGLEPTIAAVSVFLIGVTGAVLVLAGGTRRGTPWGRRHRATER